MSKTSIDGRALKQLLGAGVKGVAQNVELINELNVFPVPDGDTGINMFHTLNRAWAELDSAADAKASAVAQRFAFGALMGARGNSGTILSQLLAGFAEGLGDTERVTAPLLLAAIDMAVERAYAAVSEPVEGTVLTVAREAAQSLHEGLSIDGMLQTLLANAQAALEDSPNQLAILKDAGVVDAGGMGLVCFLQGIQEHSCGAPVELRAPAQSSAEKSAPAGSPVEAYGYDVQFIMRGAALNVGKIRSDLEELGWSVIVAGEGRMIKVHIHAENPALPLDYAFKSGAALDDIVVENMQLQAAAVARQRGRQVAEPKPAPAAVIAVVEGAGMRGVYRDLNCAHIIAGGAGKNPATEDFISAIEQLDAEAIIILPNNRNIELAARQAADLVEGERVSIVATRTVVEGVSAMIAFGDAGDGQLSPAEIASAMREAARSTTSLEITRATRSTTLQGLDIRQGDYLAIIDGRMSAAAADIKSALLDGLNIAGAEGKELATLYYGGGLSRAETEDLIKELVLKIPSLEFELIYGGQALYPLIVSVD